MKSIIKYIKLIRRYIILSFNDLIEFPFDFFMRFIQLIFEIGFIYVFWVSTFNVGVAFSNWSIYGIIILSSMNLLSEAISKISFGFRDLEYLILSGNFDKYLIRPINPFFSLIMDKLNIFTIVTKFFISLSIIIYISLTRDIQLFNISIAGLCLLFGTLSLDLLYGSFSLMAFWFGKIYSARELIFSFKTAKSYPIDIFPKTLLNIFIYFIPLAFLSTIPTKILLGNLYNPIKYLIICVFSFIFSMLIFKYTSKKALTKYNSTGS